MDADGVPRVLGALDVVPLGDVDGARLDALVRALSRRVALPCRSLPPVAAGSVPRLPHRRQVDADRALELLDELRDVGGGSSIRTVVGVTAEDLGHPLFTFFFGRARIGGSALISLHRLPQERYGLPPDEELFLQRAVRECVHEIGHVAGLHHCDDYRCVMHFVGDVERGDLRDDAPCPACAALLPAPLRHALGR